MVSGLFEEVRRAYCDNHLRPHTVNLSLGVFGKTENLPAEPLQLTKNALIFVPISQPANS